jgi:hypothetical protein
MFLAVFDRYPRKDKRMEASQIFAELADDYAGGEAALSAAILAAFDGGMLKRHPYHGPNATRPCLDAVLANRRWEDPASAPDDISDGVETFAVRAERGRDERAVDAKVARIIDDLKPKTPTVSPRQEYLERKKATATP